MNIERGSTILHNPAFENLDRQGRKIIIVLGCSGSGKTTMINLMREQDPQFHYLENDGFQFVTVMPKFGVAAVGKYKDGINCGGCDGVKPQARITEALALAWDTPYDIIMEGLLIMSSRWVLRVEHLCKELGERKIYVVVLDQTLEEAYKRVLGRNGGKEVNKQNIITKINGGKRIIEMLNNETKHLPGINVRTKIIDTSVIKKENMLYHFFEAIK